MTLALKPWSAADLPVLERANTPEMTRFIGGPETEAQVADRHERYLRLNQSGEAEMYRIDVDDVACIFFTTTPDLTAQFPALAARQLGWQDLALLCGHEMYVPDSLQRCIRVMILWNTARKPSEIVHCYLGAAAKLRPERATQPTTAPAMLELSGAWRPA